MWIQHHRPVELFGEVLRHPGGAGGAPHQEDGVDLIHGGARILQQVFQGVAGSLDLLVDHALELGPGQSDRGLATERCQRDDDLWVE